MNEIDIFLNGKKIKAQVGQTIWQVANQQNVEIPHLCYRNETSYRADGNCRACMVEV
ncbi:2Fe-2S iron-sulfur cluster-binding protein, partial [Alphaproteobacteria bacterium]|nr:2Fe-2S iron-sulfur cluster-binding protein [Alphaproteobacteria bacterium]